MSNFHRLTWIDAHIREGRYPNSRTIAEHFEISPRQAQRDVEYLRFSMGAPIEYSASKNGYYYMDQAFVLPSGFITGEDRIILSYLAGQYRMTGGERALQLAELFTRLGGDKKESRQDAGELPVFETERDRAAAFNLLAKASASRSKVKMTYRSANGEEQQRTIHPYKLFRKNLTDYVAAYCELRNEIRVFRLSRIKESAILSEKFVISLLFKEVDFGPGIGFKYREPYQALIEFDSPPEPGAFKLEARPESPDLYRISFDSSEEILAALLSHKSSFRILSPNWLKERLRDRLDKIVQRNF